MSRHRQQTVTGRLAPALHEALVAAYAAEPLARAGKDEPLLTWGRRCLPSHFAKPPSAMHAWLGRELDAMRWRRGVKLNTIGPRGAAKSTVATLAFVLRAAVEAAEPYVWIVSDTKSQAEAHLENLKAELVENLILREEYPAAMGRGPRWRSAAIELRNGVVIEAYGSGQRLRGRRRRATRPTLIVCDDLQNDRGVMSAPQREADASWFHGTLMRAGTSETNVVNVGTALHRDALAMRLTRTPGWVSQTFRSIVKWPQDMDLWQQWERLYCDAERHDATEAADAFYQRNRDAMNAGAEVLWPEEESLATLMRLRIEGGPAAFDREKQSEPVDPTRCEWPESYFDDQAWFDDWPDRKLTTVALDPSKGANARVGDYSAYVMLGVADDGVLHVEADLQRRPTAQMVADGVDLYTRWRPDAFGVEANQWQQLLAAEFVGEFRRRGLLGVTPCELHNHTPKPVRIRRLGPYLAQRRLRFKRGSPGTALLVEQLRDFPLGAHDDGPDALEMALRLAEEVWRSRDNEGAFARD